MIQLTNKLGNMVYVNPDNITVMQVCSIAASCSYTKVADSVKFDELELGVRIYFGGGFRLIVQECLREINAKIEGNEDA